MVLDFPLLFGSRYTQIQPCRSCRQPTKHVSLILTISDKSISILVDEIVWKFLHGNLYHSPCPALIDLLLLMNADSLIKSINMLSKLVVKMMKISE